MSFKLNPLLMTDGYKTGHHKMYAPNTTMVYSNYTCRSTARMNGVDDIVVFGIQYTFKYIQELWEENFFSQPKDEVCSEAKKYLSSYLMCDYDVSHFEALHDLGYLPIEVKALDEGTIISSGVPLFTIKNTHPDFFWITNFLETLISTLIWKPVHSASLALAYRKLLTKYAKETNPTDLWFVDFQAHDFSLRGMQSPEAGIGSGIGFASIFKGSDTIPILKVITHYYKDLESVYSVNATEHSVMCSGSKEGEIETFQRLMKTFPKGILSVVSDTWDLWKVLTEYLPQLKEEILARDGKLVIRPDSGDPVDIICGDSIIKDLTEVNYCIDLKACEIWSKDRILDNIRATTDHGKIGVDEDFEIFKFKGKYYKCTCRPDWNRYDKQYYFIDGSSSKTEEIELNPANKGVIELLWDTFGGTINEQGYKVLDPHIGAIYGDSITLERAEQICERLKQKGFASTNITFGVGSYSLGYATRDNQGGAVKSTYVEINGEGVEIFKDPITDDGTKKSAKGLLKVNEDLTLTHQCSLAQENTGMLQTILLNGKFIHECSFSQIRDKILSNIL